MKMKMFDFLAVGFLLSLAITLVIPFLLALIRGGDAEVTFVLTFNQYGEQWVEAVLFPIWIIMGIVTLLRMGNKIRKHKEATK